MNLKNKKVLITGASFIGYHLVTKLISKGVVSIRIINLSDRHKSYFNKYTHDIEFLTADLRSLDNAVRLTKGMDVVFHLACDHGGRGYIERNEGNTASNLLLDGSVFRACVKNDIKKLFYASSACVYPQNLQNNFRNRILLKEEMVGPPYDADNIYGWAKLMGEFVLSAYHKQRQFNSVIGRLFSVYGENAGESHAIMAIISRALAKQDPFEIWGDGKQIRNWTYVKDIVRGIVLAVEKINDAQCVNFGTNEGLSVNQLTELVFRETNFYPKTIKYMNMPVGPLNRIADYSLADKLLKWKPKYSIKEGLKLTIGWYKNNKK